MIPVRVVVADRSLAVRSVLRRLLQADDRISVVGEATDGRDLVGLVRKVRPDAMILDLDLPTLAGRALATALWEVAQVPVFAVAPRQRSATTRAAFGSHHLGVVAVFPKPDVPAEWADLGQTLVAAVLQVAADRTETREATVEPDDTPVVGTGLRYIGVGASTGGPGAIFELLQAICKESTLGVAIVQHISSGFEEALVDWLSVELEIDVAVALDGAQLPPGAVRIAPAGGHLALSKEGILRVDRGADPVDGHCPAVDVLFHSLLEHPPGDVAAVLLSGMGSDGAAGMEALHRANILTIAQDRASSAVFGMPRAAIKRNAVSFALPPAQIGRLLSRAGGK